MEILEQFTHGLEGMGGIEIAAVIFNIIYVWLLAYNNPLGWPFGIIGSALQMYVLYEQQYSFQVGLYAYYIAMGGIGWYQWKYGGKDHTERPVRYGPWKINLLIIFSGLILMAPAGYIIQHYFGGSGESPYLNAMVGGLGLKGSDVKPYLDFYTTWLGVGATAMIAWRWLENWYYWIVIDTLSIVLYWGDGLMGLVLLFIVYIVLSVVGIFQWRKQIVL